MKIRVLTSCTGKKIVTHTHKLSLHDFQCGPGHVSGREGELREHLRLAEEMYTGQQHLRLMRGVHAARRQGHSVEVKVLSAGYGLIDGTRAIAPYDATFNDMGQQAFRDWVRILDIPRQVAAYLAQPADLQLILLGDRYLDASALETVSVLGAPTIAFCGESATNRFAPTIRKIPFAQSDTKRFNSNMIGLKGELAHRLLIRVHEAARLSLDDLAHEPIATPAARAVGPTQQSLFGDDGPNGFVDPVPNRSRLIRP